MSGAFDRGAFGSGAFADRAALVTGGGSGIGRAVALRLAAGGARVVAADVSEAGAEETAALVRAAGGEARAVRADVTSASDCAAAVHTAVASFGALHLAVNAAGVGGVEARTADYPEDDWHRTLAVNLTGTWYAMRAQLPALEAAARAGGRDGFGAALVNVASVAGLTGFPLHAAYAASKHGVVGLTRTAALECARRGVRVNALCPGFTRTPMVDRMTGATPDGEAALAARIPIRRLGTVEEIAAAAAYLCSAEAAFMIGHALVVDGGIVAG